jgi:AcrR family transcriptional regulator
VSGAWEEQRAKRRAAMLAAAATLFERQGYAHTTFEEIATASDSGVATVYKYFGSKEGIVVALLLPSFERMLRKGETVILDPPKDPADAVVRMLASYRDLGGTDWASREILRLTVFPGLGNDALLADFVRSADARVQDQIRRLLVTLQRRGRLAARLPLDDATMVIFALLNQYFGAYLADGCIGFKPLFRRLERAVRLAFDDWRPARKGRGVTRRHSAVSASQA